MGIYLNPGNIGFRQMINGIYVDKTGLIGYINDTIDTPDKLTCVSRPRRFGKSFAAKMLCAYYDKSCDSKELFRGLTIEKKPSFEKYLNRFDVIYLDITHFISHAEEIMFVVKDIQIEVIKELREYFGEVIKEGEENLARALVAANMATGTRFIIIIDEWDALFREVKENEELQRSYVQFLRGLFKSGPSTDATIAGAYMTGILPIKKYGTESALTDFREYSMIKPAKLAEYVGFTEEEVKKLCADKQMSFEDMEHWYDGYAFHRMTHVYSPNSVMSAIRNEEYGSYWTSTETYESLKSYISMNRDGLKDAIVGMLGGQKMKVDTFRFQNDMTNLSSKDNVLTLLVHLGYLAYDEKQKKVYIPNQEVAEAFKTAVEDTGWEDVGNALKRSDSLLAATLDKNTEAVSEALSKIHDTSCSVLKYNDENSLACALTIAYYTAQSDYQIIREFPSGKGFADLAFIPRRHSDKKAMIIELKYDKDADTAIRQIKENQYGGEMKDYMGNMLLVGINYDKRTKLHECLIEEA